MGEGKIIKTKPISLADVKEIIEARKGEKELSYEQEITMKYVEKFSKLTKKQSDDLVKSLKEIEFLKDKEVLVYQLVNALPTKLEQVQLFLTKDVSATEEELKKVVDLTKKYGEKI